MKNPENIVAMLDKKGAENIDYRDLQQTIKEINQQANMIVENWRRAGINPSEEFERLLQQKYTHHMMCI